MTRWTNGRLDLGSLGVLVIVDQSGDCHWTWQIAGYGIASDYRPRTEARAKRSAISWLRRALKQAARRLEGGK